MTSRRIQQTKIQQPESVRPPQHRPSTSPTRQKTATNTIIRGLSRIRGLSSRTPATAQPTFLQRTSHTQLMQRHVAISAVQEREEGYGRFNQNHIMRATHLGASHTLGQPVFGLPFVPKQIQPNFIQRDTEEDERKKKKKEEDETPLVREYEGPHEITIDDKGVPTYSYKPKKKETTEVEQDTTLVNSSQLQGGGTFNLDTQTLGLTGERTQSVELKGTKDEKVIYSSSDHTKGDLSFGITELKGGFNLEHNQTRQYGEDFREKRGLGGGMTIDLGEGGSLDGIGGSLSHVNDQTTIDQGTEVTQGTQHKVGLSGDLANKKLTGSGSRTTTVEVKGVGDDDPTFKQTNETTVGGTIDFKEHKGTVNVGHTQVQQIGDKKETRGVSGSLTVDLSEEGELEGLDGSTTLTRNSTTVTIGGGFVVKAEKPKETEDGRYVVTWQRLYTGSIGGGHTKEYSPKKSVGGSVTFAHKNSTVGSKHFATEASALAFYKGKAWKDIDPDNAHQLGVGDTITQSSDNSLTISGNGRAWVLNVGASIDVGKGHSVKITGLGGKKVRVLVKDTWAFGASGSIGAPGISLSGGFKDSTTSGIIVTFNLNTRAGQNAFNYLKHFGKLDPNNQTGYTMRGTVRGQESQRSHGASLLGANITSTEVVSEEIITYDSGETVETRTGSDGIVLKIPLIGSYSTTDSFKAVETSKDKKRRYTVTATVSGSSADDVHNKIASATGVGGHRQDLTDAKNQSKRVWTVSYRFTQEHIRKLAVEIGIKNNWNPSALFNFKSDGVTLQQVIKNATDWDQIDTALTVFVSETGDRGLAMLRQTIGYMPQYNIKLKDDRYLTGESGHTRLAQKMKTWGQKLDANQSVIDVGGQIANELIAQRKRLRAISSIERYPDLPQELRQKEVYRTRKEVEKLVALQKRASTLIKAYHEAVEKAEREVCDPDVNYTPVPNSVLVKSEWEAAEEARSRMSTRRNNCVETGNKARYAFWVHNGAWIDGTQSAYEKFGQRHWYGDDAHPDVYELALSHFRDAERAWKQAEKMWALYDDKYNEIDQWAPSQQVGAVETTLVGMATRVGNKYAASMRSFSNALAKFDWIRKKYPEYRGLWRAYEQGRPLPTSRRLK